MATLVIMPRQGQSVESCVITEWKKKKGETVYSIRAFPIGGFCAIAGEETEDDIDWESICP